MSFADTRVGAQTVRMIIEALHRGASVVDKTRRNTALSHMGGPSDAECTEALDIVALIPAPFVSG